MVKMLEAEGHVTDLEFRLLTKQGEVRRCIASLRLYRDKGILEGSVQDITGRKLNEDKLRESQLILEGIINAIPVRVFWKDKNLIYLGCNKIFAEDAGFNDPKEIIGKDDFQMTWSDQAELYRGDDRSVIESNKSKLLIEEPQTTPDGNTITLLTNKIPLRNSIGEITGMIGTYIDITELKHKEKELLEAKERAEQSDKLKSEFLAQMSHEIRSPMNAILSFSNIIKEDINEKLTQDQLKYFNGIESAGQRLIRTVDLILNTSEMHVGTYQPYFNRIKLIGEVIESVKHDYTKQINEKGLILNIVSNVPEVIIVGDKYSVLQIFMNLIDNAVKYTSEGSIIIKVDKNKDEIKVIIEDTGIGMSEEFMTRMYEPFRQEERGYSRRFEGNGLGLSLVKKYCELNRITIEVESKKDIGTKFTLTFNRT